MTPPAPANFVQPVVLEGHGVRLEPLAPDHEAGFRAAAADGELWTLRYTSVPEPENTAGYIAAALADRERGVRFPFIVRETAGGAIVGSTSYHDILPATRRLEIGYTFYARSWQRSFVNTACKWLLLEHAFERLHCSLVGWRTDILNLRSQAAIERLGAKREGVIRRNALRRDGTVRDSVLYGVTAEEWRESVRQRVRGLLSGARGREMV